MIAELLTTTDAAYGAALPVSTRHLLVQIVDGRPVVHLGGGQLRPVVTDTAGLWSYQRMRGDLSIEKTAIQGDPCAAVRVQVPLRIVAILQRDTCVDVLQAAVEALHASRGAISTAVGAYSVQIDRIAYGFDMAAQQESIDATKIPTHLTLAHIDLQVSIYAKESCLTSCDTRDVLCALIDKATNEKIVECLGQERVDVICAVAPCPLSYAVLKSDASVIESGTVPNACTDPSLEVVVADSEVRTSDGLVLVDSIKAEDPYLLRTSVIRYHDQANNFDATAPLNTAFNNGVNLNADIVIPRREIFNTDNDPLGLYVTLDDLINDTVPQVPVGVAQCPLEFVLAPGEAETLEIVVTANMAGTYATFTDDGASGAWTYNKNNGGYAAIGGTITLAINDTIRVARTISTAQGRSTWEA